MFEKTDFYRNVERKEEYFCESEIINHSFDQNEENGDIENKERDNF